MSFKRNEPKVVSGWNTLHAVMLVGVMSLLSSPAADPLISTIGKQTVLEDGTHSFDITISGDVPLTVTNVAPFSPLLSSISVSPATGTSLTRSVTVIPNLDAVGLNITNWLRITDTKGVMSTNNFVLDITPVNDQPSFIALTNKIVVDEDAGPYSEAWATPSAGPSDESTQVLTFKILSNSNTNLFVALPTISTNGTLFFQSATNDSGTAQLSVVLMDDGGTNNSGVDESAAFSLEIMVKAVNDPPFAVDDNNVNTTNRLLTTANDTLIITNATLLANDTDVEGDTLSITGVTVPTGPNNGNNQNGILTPGVDSYSYDPDNKFKNLNPGETNLVTFDYTVSDSLDTDTGQVTIEVVGVNDPPVISAGVNPSTIPDDVDASPFLINSIDDPDDNANAGDFVLSMELISGGNLGRIRPPTGETFPYTGSITEISNFVSDVVFSPYRNQIGGFADVEVQFRLQDGSDGVGTNVVTLTIQGVNDVPDILGTTSETFRTTDDPADEPVKPFERVTIVDVDQGQTNTLSITLSNPESGILSTNQIVGTSEDITRILRDVTFKAVPAPGRVVGTSETIVVTITSLDTAGESRSDSKTRIAVTAVNGSPLIEGLPANGAPVLLSPKRSLNPFAGLSVTDDDPNVTVTITMDDPAKGTLVSTNGVNFEETFSGSGVYRYEALIAAVNEALTNLVFEVSDTYLFDPDSPGGATFTLRAEDRLLNTTIESLSVLVQEEPRSWLVTRTEDDAEPGSLRFAVEQAIAAKENNALIAFALPEYPAVVRLTNSLSLTRNIAFAGPGADLLAISGDSTGDGVPNTRIFEVEANVSIRGLKLSHGIAETGGAIYVSQSGRLAIRDCTIEYSEAVLWGGAVDVEQGELYMDRCLILENKVVGGSGLGGGGISLYTDKFCTIANTTFSQNSQLSDSGFGGGALYVENVDSGSVVEIRIVHCTFAENTDAANRASAVLSNAAGSRVLLQNTILADAQGRNIEVLGGGEIVTLGGNLSDDSTRTVLGQSGQPDDIFLLDHDDDLTDVDSASLLLTFNGSVYSLPPGGAAIDHALASSVSLDQRGVIRGPNPDSGAFEHNQFRRIVINEINTQTNAMFVEIYVPRDSTPVDFSGMQLLSQGTPVHVFPADTILQPGVGVIVGAPGITNFISTNALVLFFEPSLTDLVLDVRGALSVMGTNGNQSPIADAIYIGAFADLGATTNDLVVSTNSLTLSPQFRGSSFLPHSLVKSPPLGGANFDMSGALDFAGPPWSPGGYSPNTPFGSPNAFPVSTDDFYFASEDDLKKWDVLLNDIDADGRDDLIIVAVADSVTNLLSTNLFRSSVEGATISVGDLDKSVVYNPRNTAGIQSMVGGDKRTDSFFYSIIDYGTGAISGFEEISSNVVRLVSPAHRLTNGVSIRIDGATTNVYNKVFPVTYIDEDAVSIAVRFVGDGGSEATWRTVMPRVPSQPAETRVEVTLLGANDPPMPVDDSFVTKEETVIRIMADTLQTGTVTNFTSDSRFSPAPTVLGDGFLADDFDPDRDDTGATLNVIGVLGEVSSINGFEGVVGVSPVTVRSGGHGLNTGTRVLISNYGGHPSYNGYHEITVVDADSFSVPVSFVDDDNVKGIWALLEDAERLSTTSAKGAGVELELRSNRAESSIIYNPQVSDELNTLSLDQETTDIFYYAVSDRHGAIGIAAISILVTGVNDDPVVGPDPASIAQIVESEGASAASELLTNGTVYFHRVPDAANPSRVESGVQIGAPGEETRLRLTRLPATDEDTLLVLDPDEFLENDSDVDGLDQLVGDVAGPVSALGASVTLNLGGHIEYDPSVSDELNMLARGETVIDTFEMLVLDNEGGSVPSLVAVLVIGLNDSPVAVADAHFAVEGQVTNITELLINDIEHDINGRTPDNRKVFQSVVNQATSIDGVRYSLIGQELHYDPTGSGAIEALGAGQPKIDTFDYVVTDGSFVFANNDQFKVVADGAGFVLDVLANDRNLTGNDTPITISSVGPPSEGGSVVSDGAMLTYTPLINFVGDEFFTYVITDGVGNTDVASVSVRALVDVLNGNLQANDDVFSAARGEIAFLDVLANDNVLPDNGEDLQITRIVTGGNQGGSFELENGSFRYMPSATAPVGGYPYDETMTYEISAGGPARADATVTVTVQDRSNTLLVRNDFYSVVAGSFENTFEVLFNDSFEPGGGVALTIRSVSSGPISGTISTNAEGSLLLYSPNPGFVGLDSFTYEAQDGFGGTGSATVRVSVGDLSTDNDFFTVPYIEAGSAGPFTTNVLDVLANDRVIQNGGDNVSIIGFLPNTNSLGTLTFSGDRRSLHFVPFPGALGDQLFVYSISDGSGATATGEVTVSVRESGVRANSDFFTILAGSSATSLDVLLNDVSLPDTERPVSVFDVGVGLDGPNRGGLVSIGATNKSLIYTPAPGFVGQETFTYASTDGRQTDIATVVVNVTSGELNSNDDVFTVFFETGSDGTPRSFELPVLLNDIVLPNFGESLQITDAFMLSGAATNSPAIAGRISIDPEGRFITYTPGQTNDPFPYVEMIQYEVSDGSTGRQTSIATVEVRQRSNIRDSETNSDVFSVAASSLGNILPVLLNDGVKPASAGAWIITDVSDATHNGRIQISGSNLIYVPQPGFIGADTFEYFVSDGVGGTGSGRVTVHVGDLPVSGDEFVALSGSQGNVFDVLANDAVRPDLPDNYALLDVVEGPDQGGTATVVDNQIQYAPGSAGVRSYPYVERFVYRVKDDSGGTVSASAAVHVYEQGSDRDLGSVAVTIIGRNDPPTITGTVSNQTVYERGVIRPFASVTIDDVDFQRTQPLKVTVDVGTPGNGVLTALGSFVDQGAGRYLLQAVRPDEATASIRSLVFVPSTEQRVQPGLPELTQFTIAVDDQEAPPVMDFHSSVIAVDADLGDLDTGNASAEDGFGTAVAASQDQVVVGSPRKAGAGVVHVYGHPPGNSDNWSIVQTLGAPTPAYSSGFGTAVAIDGDTLVVGAPIAVDQFGGTGNAHIFRRDSASQSWVLEKTLYPTETGSQDRFGGSVAVKNETVAIGSPNDVLLAQGNVGSVHVFERGADPENMWSEVVKIVPFDFNAGDQFGTAVALSNNELVVGSPMDDMGGLDSGSVYVFQRGNGGLNQWGVAEKLTPDDAASGDQFGKSVQIDSGRIAVGAWLSDANGTDAGAAYSFTNTGGSWIQESRITDPNGNGGDQFGASLGLDGSYLVVGSPRNDKNGTDTGLARVFLRSNDWNLIDTLEPDSNITLAEFGTATAAGQGIAVVGTGADPSWLLVGRASIYQLRYNNAPTESKPIPDQVAFVGVNFGYMLPSDSFGDPDVDARLDISIDDGLLPSGLVFDSNTWTLSGVPIDAGDYVVSAVATDELGKSATNTFSIAVWDQSGASPGGQIPGIVPALQIGLEQESGRFVVSFLRTAGMAYSLQVSANLSDWVSGDTLVYREEVAAAGEGTDRVRLHLQGFGAGDRFRFYRVIVWP